MAAEKEAKTTLELSETMITLLKQYGRLRITVTFAVMCLFCFGLSLFRAFYSGTNVFLFLNWNLFLAFIPWLFSSFIVIHPKLQSKKLAVFIVLATWLLFFPNAPYILTDLFHLRLQLSMPVWFDLVLIMSFAWTGLLFGFMSLADIESFLRKFASPKITAAIVSLLLFLGSFGIYLGRYLRWNSWDIISEPLNLLYDIGDRFLDPLAHPRTWGVTLFMGLLLNLMYWSLKSIRATK